MHLPGRGWAGSPGCPPHTLREPLPGWHRAQPPAHQGLELSEEQELQAGTGERNKGCLDSGGDSRGGSGVGDRGVWSCGTGRWKVLHMPCRTGWLVTQEYSAVPFLVSNDQLAFFFVLIQEIISFSLVSMETSL